MPWLRSPVRASVWARSSTTRWASAFCSAIDTCAANSRTRSKLARLEDGALAQALEVEDAEHALLPAQWRQDERSRLAAAAAAAAATADAAGLARGQYLRHDRTRIGQAAVHEGVGADTAGQQRARARARPRSCT